MTQMENALSKISSMKKPFVNNYLDQSAKDAMEALQGLEDSLKALDAILEKAELK